MTCQSFLRDSIGLIAILCLSISAQAGRLTNFTFGLGAFYSFEKANDGTNYDLKLPIAGRVGYRFSEIDLLFEYSRFQASQGTQTVDVKRTHHEFVLWMRHTLKSEWWLAPVIAVGTGVQTDSITTRFESDSRTDQGTLRALASASLGARWAITQNLKLVGEGRATFSSDYNPNPLLGAGAFVEWVF